MQNTRKITNDITFLGVNERKLTIFEGVYPLPNGVSYNSYLVSDDKTILFDTADKHCSQQFFENLDFALNSKTLDYLVVQHLEPDHSALILEVVKKYPQVKILCSAKANMLLSQFFEADLSKNVQIVKEGDSLKTKNHEFVFVNAPMVHWPEVIVTYDKTTKSLFSADAFGSFGVINGNLYDDEIDFCDYIPEARRYYTNIVGKYGQQVQALLKKASNLEIETIFPLHGVIIRKNISKFVELYDKWSSYTPEEKAVVVAYSSVYGNTENLVDILSSKLADKGVKNIKVYDTTITHPSYILSESFRASHLIIATTTYNNGIFETMETFLHQLRSHCLKNRKIAIIQNGSWAPVATKLVEEIVGNGNEIISNSLTIKSSLKTAQNDELNDLVNVIINSLN